MADKRKWRSERCGNCGGFGIVSDYSGGDFNGPKECNGCNGNGGVWIHKKTGTVAEYPGGRLLGREPVRAK